MAYVLAFAIDSDALIRTAFWTGIVAIILTVLLVGTVIVLRISWINQQRKRRKILRRWEPLVQEAIGKRAPSKEQSAEAQNVRASLPDIPRNDRLYLLEYWNDQYEKAKPDARLRLQELGRTAGIDKVALDLADSDYLWRQLLGLQTLGHLSSPAATEKLKKYVKSNDNVVSLTAARSLTKADPDAAIPEIMPLIRRRRDWAEPRVAEMLIEAGVEKTNGHLASLFTGASEVEQTRLVRFVGATHSSEGMREVTAILERDSAKKEEWRAPAKDTNEDASGVHRTHRALIVAALSVLDKPEYHDLVVPYLSHPDWQVREAATTALGRVATPDDEKRLGVLMRDDHWWVRYRAAQALAHAPNITVEELRRRIDAEQNPGAQDVLRHVLAEREIARS